MTRMVKLSLVYFMLEESENNQHRSKVTLPRNVNEMNMKYFIGITPPDDYKEKIVAFRNRWSSNRLNDVVEPHITVKAQGGLTADLHWLESVRETCSLMPSFQLSLSEPESFGNAVTFLSVETSKVIELHRKLVKVIYPSQELIDRYFEMDKYHPHFEDIQLGTEK